MATIKKPIRDEIVAQSLNEIVFARQHKQGKIKNWQKNEDMYYAKKVATNESRANVELGRMQEFVHTLLSKIDNPLVFKFTKRKESQLKRVARLNALRAYDGQRDFWDLKDIVGKKQATIYGRAIYSYHADSVGGVYSSHLDPTDVYDFLIDPSAGGIDMERAMNLGRYGVVKTRQELEDGVKEGLYLRTEVKELLDQGASNADESSQEEKNKTSRTYGTNVYTAQKEYPHKDKFKFWEWYTTYEGDRYYLLISESGGRAVRIEKLTDVFESNMWPFWSWAPFPDLTEFWTPSYCDYVREVFMAQSVTINQMLDNAEQINKPQKVVNVSAIEELTDLKYKRDGIIRVAKNFDVDKAVQFVRPAPIDTPLQVFDKLESIHEKASGVNADAKGTSDEEKVGIYEGNVANTADRFGLLNKSYSFGYRRFARLYEAGVREHCNKKIAIDILGPNGIDLEYVSKSDMFRKNDKDEYGIVVEASDAEEALSELEKRTKLAFLAAQRQNPEINPRKATEIEAKIAGFSEDDVRQLMDKSEFGDAELMSEAERDIEAILDGESIEPNMRATTAYKQRFVDYMIDHAEDISQEQFQSLEQYIKGLDQIIVQNTVRAAQTKMLKMQLAAMEQGAMMPAPASAGAPAGAPAPTDQPSGELPEAGAPGEPLPLGA